MGVKVFRRGLHISEVSPGVRVSRSTAVAIGCGLTSVVALSFVGVAPAVALGATSVQRASQNPVLAAPSSSSGPGVYRWGSYKGGGAGYRQGTPTLVPGLSGVSALAASNSSNYASLSNGQVWAWGGNRQGQLGNASGVRSDVNPVEVAFAPDTDIKAIGEGFNAGYGIDSNGNGWAWGKWAVCARESHDFVPNEVSGLSNLAAVSGGGRHVMWLTKSGAVYTCGDNDSGQLGVGSQKFSGTPLEVAGLPAPAVAISAGNNFSTALLTNGQVWDWGQGDFGQLGNATMAASNVPVEVQLPAGTYATQIYAGGDVVVDGDQIAMLNNGEVVAWGSDSYGQLGDGRRINESTPVPVAVPSGVTFKSVAAGGEASYGIDTDGNLWAWGANFDGQIGLQHSKTFVLIPVKVDSNVTIISATARDVVDYHP